MATGDMGLFCRLAASWIDVYFLDDCRALFSSMKAATE